MSFQRNPVKYLRSFERRIRRVAHENRLSKYFYAPLRNNFVFYEAFDGLGINCNPAAIFESLIANRAYSHLHHVWSIRDADVLASLIDKFADFDNISFVKYRSITYFEMLSTCKYLINNSTFPHEFAKRNDQVYINTWHGIPVKKMGYEVPNGRSDARNVVRNFLSADYILSSGAFFSEDILSTSFKLSNIYQGKILEVGQPRVARMLELSASKQLTIHRLEKQGIFTAGKKVILFAPTWKGANAYNVHSDISEIIDTVTKIQSNLGSSYTVLAKVHQLALRTVNPRELPDFILPRDIDTSEILSITDQLITDYSSIFVDYLALDRPVHFIFSDYESYAEDRGLYFSVDDLPGSVNYDVLSVTDSILKSSMHDSYSAARISWKRRYALEDTSDSTKNAISIIFGKQKSEKILELGHDKKRLLIHAGSLIPNGITTAVINLISRINYDEYDVTVIFPYSSKSFQTKKSMELDERARLMPRVGNVSMRWFQRRAYWAYTKGGGLRTNSKYRDSIKPIFSREWRRCFGDSDFDIVIGFDGYQVFWGELLLRSNAKRKYLWAHNDLLLDAHRTIGSKKPHFKNLMSVFPMYGRFTKIVSVTEELARINSNKLGRYADPSRFTHVRNFVDGERILSLAGEHIRSATRQRGPNFVTVGRLSPEKNQARIIRSFARVNERYRESTLTIVGDGPLMSELVRLVAELDISESVEFVGLQENPFPFVRNSDCFLFASEYEGQGLAILEALVLKVPVITTRFNVVEDVLGPRDGIVVDSTDSDLTAALFDFCEKGLPVPSFDFVKYNVEVSSELDQLLHIQ
ncbi:glycosyltransferase [Glutamicibacter protophormiae]|uniref:CDP-glycerol glycerophosphotransferase (TagB/SpsB family)/glycosyltransferase involved in cell wall biosynthesis n=1 Tax=Glutamicibacter protophormiae TaxID=37930 RepID=A0ABS4XSF4_GLUPR|nr:glycosyltransferase [Glutamicibacter protophormiae]MBP2399412.1 CDP-glycerol glycerophosphotransferase (TagB/SpsB family)/glycosyltransferase involved in cell wall biosynthesis [Glutamicibacter protophormiae]